MYVNKECMTYEERKKIGLWMAEKKLDDVNKAFPTVVVKDSFYVRYGKRFFDVIIALLFLIITLPINVVIGVITIFDVGFPIFFVQERIGKDGRIFKLIKFRNMRNEYNENGELLLPNQRISKWGRFVRKTSLDELLNFWFVLKGDMSLIGPRPLLPEYQERYCERHKQRNCVRPGLECPPRDFSLPSRTWQEQFENDVWYVENVSFRVDCMLMFHLIGFALDSQNSTSRAVVSRGYFMGYSQENEAISLEDIPEEYIEQIYNLSQCG